VRAENVTRRGYRRAVVVATFVAALGMGATAGATSAGAAPKPTRSTVATTSASGATPSTTLAPASTRRRVAKAAAAALAPTTTTSTTVVDPSSTTLPVPASTTTTTPSAPASTTTTTTSTTGTTSTSLAVPAPRAAVDAKATVSSKTVVARPRTTRPVRTHPWRAGKRQAAAVALAASVSRVPATDVTAPSGITADCSSDVSGLLNTWLNSLPANSRWAPPTGSCFLVDHGLELRFLSDLTIDGGTFEDLTAHAPPQAGHGTQRGHAAIAALGGTGLTLENLNILGVHNGFSYRPSMAFEGGIQLDGTADTTISNVGINHTFGDGIDLEPLRGGDDYKSGSIVQPVEGLTVSGVTIHGVGRQGITAASVDGATISNVSISGVGFNSFDFESDEQGEGAKNVLIDGCSFSGINISMDGPATGPITVQNCTMTKTDKGDAVLVSNTSGKPLSGPIVLTDDVLRCGASAYVSCFQLGGASDVTVEDSAVTIGFHGDTLHESAYTISDGSHVTFADDVVHGFGRVGTTRGGSTATVTGGTWAGIDCGGHAFCPAR
jgi:hypothetical protein